MTDALLDNLRQSPQMPVRTRPIVAIGAGGIVRDAHQPAYRIASFETGGGFRCGPGSGGSVGVRLRHPAGVRLPGRK